MKYSPQIGDKHGRLTVIGALVKARHYRLVPTRCECGTEKTIRADHLGSGRTKSCGCLSIDTLKQPRLHGEAKRESKTPEWLVWVSMRRRCCVPSDPAYPSYGGRGITVYSGWLDSFATFLRDVGRKPTPDHTLDRIDNSLGYSPSNCRWATRTEQANNRRSNRMIEIHGTTQSLAQWARELGFAYGTVRARLERGWSTERAFNKHGL